MKTIWLLQGRDRARRESATRRAAALCVEAAWPAAAIRVSLLTALHGEDTRKAPADLLIQCWSETPIAPPARLAAHLEQDFDLAALAIEERVRKDVSGWSGLGQAEGVSLLAFCLAPEGQPRAETLRHWTEHVPLALAAHHGAQRYIQNIVLEASGPWFGVADLKFPDREGAPGYLFRDQADIEAVNADTADFIAASPVLFAVETVLKT